MMVATMNMSIDYIFRELILYFRCKNIIIGTKINKDSFEFSMNNKYYLFYDSSYLPYNNYSPFEVKLCELKFDNFYICTNCKELKTYVHILRKELDIFESFCIHTKFLDYFKISLTIK